MATARLVASAYALSSTSYFSVTYPERAYNNTDNTEYATFQTTSRSTSSRYVYLKGFNFSAIPSTANVSSFTVKIKLSGTGLSSSAAYPCLCDNTTAISGASTTTRPSTTVQTITIPTGSLTWDTIKNTYGSDFAIRIDARRSSRNTASYLYIYGAEIEVTYTAEDVHVSSVSLDKNSITLEEGETEQLTETVLPSNATDKSVTWSSSNTSVATVSSSGLVTAVSHGSATITVTTTDGNKTATCSVTVNEPHYTQYRLTNTATPGKDYLIGNGDSGSIYLLSNESGGSRQLEGVQVSVSNGIVSITDSQAAKCLFSLDLYTAGNDVTTAWSINGQYLYCDNANGLRMNSPATLDRFWHYNDHKFWQFKSTASDGYSDTSSEYKYYLTWNNGIATDSHVDTAGIENSDIPATYLFEEYTPGTDELYIKVNGSWVAATNAYRKVNGSWVEYPFTSVFVSGVDYKYG